MAADDPITPEKLKTWLKPRAALSIVRRSIPDIAIAAAMIVGRLKGGKIIAGAASSSWGESGSPTSAVLISAASWSHQSGRSPDWWDTGDVRFFFPSKTRGQQSRTGRFYGVRFDPAGIEEILREHPPPKKVIPTAPTPAQAEIVNAALSAEREKTAPSTANAPEADPNQLTEEEFGRWEPVRDVVAFVQTKQPFLYQDTIKARVRSGSLRTAVKKMVELDDAGDPVAEWNRRTIMPGWIDNPDPRFWDLGDHSVQMRRDSTGYAGLRVSTEIEGVRFHPDDVDELRRDLGLPAKRRDPAAVGASIDFITAQLDKVTEAIGTAARSHHQFNPSIDQRRREVALDVAVGLVRAPTALTPGPPADQEDLAALVQAVRNEFGIDNAAPLQKPTEAKPPSESKLPKVPTKELREWYRTQFVENPGLTFGEVEALASRHFKGRRVTRQPLRDVIGELGHTATQGNPTFRRK